MKATLKIERSDGTTESRDMPVGTWIIGREAGDLILGDSNVSGRHAEVILTDSGLFFTDLGSTNGSFLRGERLSQRTELTQGDSITMGGCTLGVLQLARAGSTAKGTAIMEAQPQAVVTKPASREPKPASDSPLKPASGAHPKSKVRHSYPLAITDASLSTAMGLLMRTMPYALARFGILVSMSVVSIIWMLITLGGGAWLGSKVPILGYAWFIIGAGAYGWLWRTVVRYFLYLLKAGHIAVLTELITKGSVQNGETGMFDYGKAVVTQRFGQVNAMFALDLLIHGVVRAFNRTLNWIANLLPIPGLSGVTSIVNKIVFAATTYIDETMFSYSLARDEENVWKTSQEGLVYYAQNCKEVLKTGVWIVILDYVLTGVAWVVMLVPAFVITLAVPDSIAGGTGLFAFLVAVLFASNIRAAFLKPLFLTMVMTKFHVSIQGQEINEEWDDKLTTVSSKFKEIKDKALGFIPKKNTAASENPAAA